MSKYTVTPAVAHIMRPGARTTDPMRIEIIRSPEFNQYLRTLGGYAHANIAKMYVKNLIHDDGHGKVLRWANYQQRITQVRAFRRLLNQGYDFTPRKIRTLAELKEAAAGTRQIPGDSLMLADFWARAAELAERRGYCSVYDGMAAALGGPRRR